MTTLSTFAEDYSTTIHAYIGNLVYTYEHYVLHFQGFSPKNVNIYTFMDEPLYGILLSLWWLVTMGKLMYKIELLFANIYVFWLTIRE